jgi:hypothetical protein
MYIFYLFADIEGNIIYEWDLNKTYVFKYNQLLK